MTLRGVYVNIRLHMNMETRIESFKKEYPQHAERIAKAVHDWYQYAVNGYIIGAPQVLQSTTGRFLQTASTNPDEVYITNIPLSFALEQKQKAMLDKFKCIPPAVYIARFGSWFNTNLTNDQNPDKRTSIEALAALHIFSWLGSLPPDFKQAEAVWDVVDENLTQISEGKLVKSHPASGVLISCIQFAVIEQFMTDVYAPNDLFGGAIQN